MSPEARERTFDELARGLASGNVTRGKALKLVGAALVGGALASIPGIAWAKPNKPEGAKCNHNHQCASEQCVEGRCGGGEPICNPPCPEGEECMQGVPAGQPPFCEPVCTPSCPEGTCGCVRRGDGSGNVCTAFGTGVFVSSCDECPPTDFPENTVCIDLAPSPDTVLLACEPPCPQQT
jgi:hypothetical protein